ncbi:MAG: DUF2851 family protein [Bacteroidetes bacterium]|nr:DUF2851 family protein [Bacteroidota bacterium]
MKEEFLHFIWMYELFNKNDLHAKSGEKIEIMYPGQHNSDAGPDFINAKVKIDGTLWVGNVEIHILSSDWQKHGHNNDKAYDNVILHVVFKDDRIVTRSNGDPIPAMELTFRDKLYENYETLLLSRQWIPCNDHIFRVDPFFIKQWLFKLSVERIESKTSDIQQMLLQNKQSWEESFYQALAGSFGFKKNSEPFRFLARSLPLKYLGKHKDNLLQIEAMLFGQAGFLQTAFPVDEYQSKLKKEYEFLQKKFSLKPLGEHLWKFMRLRPSNFPTIRIAQFSMLIHHSSFLFSKIIQTKDPGIIKDFFRITASEYWDVHYRFGKKSTKRVKKIGETGINNILINTAAPFIFLYGKSKGITALSEQAIDILESLPPEDNSIIIKWRKLGIKAENASDSQALLQLKNVYCNQKKCLNCQIGNQLILQNSNEE